jgi:trehalose 6-phosphate synthase
MTKLIVCSHRGPVSHRTTADGFIPQAAGPGGLVPVMLPALERVGGTWLFAPMTDADREMAATNGGGNLDGIRLRLVALPSAVHREHYETVTNSYLARVFHYLFPVGRDPTFDARFRHAWECYRAVNEIYAAAIRAERGGEAILIEDMHLMLVAAALRRSRRAPDVPLLYFHHVPWSAPDYFGILPSAVREEILRGVLAHDSVAFHSKRWVDAFGACCERFVPGAEYGDGQVALEGRAVPTIVAPAALDAGVLREVAARRETAAWRTRFDERRAGRKLLVRVDRADLWKNVLRGLEAYGGLLERRPDLRARVWFLAVLSPTRMWIPEYRDYLAACQRSAEAINDRFGDDAGDGRTPVTVDLPDGGTHGDRERALGALTLADAVLVNPVFDGLNLVAKEAVAAGRNDPVLVLSENAGVHDELGRHALSINPFDLEDTAAALEGALDMGAEERAGRASALRAIVDAYDPHDWLAKRLAGLA